MKKMRLIVSSSLAMGPLMMQKLVGFCRFQIGTSRHGGSTEIRGESVHRIPRILRIARIHRICSHLAANLWGISVLHEYFCPGLGSFSCCFSRIVMAKVMTKYQDPTSRVSFDTNSSSQSPPPPYELEASHLVENGAELTGTSLSAQNNKISSSQEVPFHASQFSQIASYPQINSLKAVNRCSRCNF